MWTAWHADTYALCSSLIHATFASCFRNISVGSCGSCNETVYSILRHGAWANMNIYSSASCVRIRRVLPQFGAWGWSILHDNERTYVCEMITRLVSAYWVVRLSILPWSFANRLLHVSKTESGTERNWFPNISDIQVAVAWDHKAVAKEDYFRSFQHLYEHCQKCITSGG